jgi:Mannosyltransferase OCH1 and related enzymes
VLEKNTKQNQKSEIIFQQTANDTVYRGYEEEGEHNKTDILDEIHEISGALEDRNLYCPPPLVKFQNRLVRKTTTNNEKISSERFIPKVLHVSMKSRCLPQDLARTLERWMTQFPNYSVFFHDDKAVAKLIGQEWPEFPNLHRAMKCVFFNGAMTIDIWRVLILWKYGGVYTDIDNWPEDVFTEDIIPSNVSAFFFPDGYNRPSQWFMALEPRHPIMYDSMLTIIHNIFQLTNLRRPPVVKVTGPNAVKEGYTMFFPHLWLSGADAVLQNNNIIIGKFGKAVFKLWNGDYRRSEHIYVSLKKGYNDIVPFNETLNVTRKERIEMQSGVLHWQKEIHNLGKGGGGVPRMSCMKYLELLDQKGMS